MSTPPYGGGSGYGYGGSGYGGGPAYGGGGNRPPGYVSFGWIGEAWALFTANGGVWVAAAAIYAVPFIGAAFIGFSLGVTSHLASPALGGRSALAALLSGGGMAPGLNLLFRLFSWAWQAFFYGGVFRMAVRQVRGEVISVEDIFSGGPTFGRFLGLTFVYGIVSLLSCCIIPGILLSALLLPAPAMAVDGFDFGGAINKSTEYMKGDLMNGSLLIVALFFIVLLSAIPCGLGLLATGPMCWIISALAYRDMVGFPGPPGAGPNYGQSQPGVWPPPPGSPGATPPPYFP